MSDPAGENKDKDQYSDHGGSEDHIALIYESTGERLSAITPLIKVGLEKGELCLYISNKEEDLDIVDALRSEHIDVEKAMGNGGLILTDQKEIYFKQGRFDPDWTIRVLKNIADLARSYGFTAMRIMSEMTWTLEKIPGVERWTEYEAKLNDLDVGVSLRVICQYDRAQFTPEVLIDAIRTHPKIVTKGAICKNHFFVPPSRLLAGDSSGLELDMVLESIRNGNNSEAELLDRKVELDETNLKLAKEIEAKKGLETALDEVSQEVLRYRR